MAGGKSTFLFGDYSRLERMVMDHHLACNAAGVALPDLPGRLTLPAMRRGPTRTAVVASRTPPAFAPSPVPGLTWAELLDTLRAAGKLQRPRGEASRLDLSGTRTGRRRSLNMYVSKPRKPVEKSGWTLAAVNRSGVTLASNACVYGLLTEFSMIAVQPDDAAIKSPPGRTYTAQLRSHEGYEWPRWIVRTTFADGSPHMIEDPNTGEMREQPADLRLLPAAAPDLDSIHAFAWYPTGLFHRELPIVDRWLLVVGGQRISVPDAYIGVCLDALTGEEHRWSWHECESQRRLALYTLAMVYVQPIYDAPIADIAVRTHDEVLRMHDETTRNLIGPSFDLYTLFGGLNE